MDIEYRRLTQSDLPLALGMNADFRAGFADRAAVEKFLADGRNLLFAAISGGRVIGFAYGYRMARLDGNPDMIYIHEVGVVEAMQRRGVGTAMLGALLDGARREGISKVFLVTSRANVAANALYRRAGGELGVESNGDDVCWFFRTN